MSKNFEKVRRKTRLSALICAVILGIGIGASSVAVIAAVLKLIAVPFNPLYILIGVGVATVLSILLFLCFMPSRKRLAKRIDEEHSLNEKLRTMLQLEGEDDEFAQLQREDADERLGQIKVNPWRRKQWISALVTFTLSLGCILGSIVIPARADEGERPIDEFDKQWIIAGINETIAYVKGSFLSVSVQEYTVSELEGLIVFVNEHNMMSEIKDEAIRIVIDINKKRAENNTAVTVGDSLKSSTTPALALFGQGLADLSTSGVSEGIDSLKQLLLSPPTDGASRADIALNAADEIAYAYSDIATSDETVKALKNVTMVVREYADDTSRSLDDAFASASVTLSTEVLMQSLTRDVIKKVTADMCALFGILESDLEAESGDLDIDITPPGSSSGDKNDPDDNEGNDKPNDNLGSGGIGNGDMIYGSNDVIYDYYTNTYRPFGEVLAEYRAKANEKANENADEMLAELIREYFRQISVSGTGSGSEN